MASPGATGAGAGNGNDDWEQVLFQEAITQSQSRYAVSHAAHCFLWSRVTTPIRGLDHHDLDPRAAVLMHLRFDGKIGFPGGFVDASLNGASVQRAKEIVANGLNRELVEELKYDIEKHPITFSDYQFTHRPTNKTAKPFFEHFFTHELPLADMQALEARALQSEEFGREVGGNFRVPLYTMSNGHSGLPEFLNHNFIGNAREQLTEAIISLQIMTQEEVGAAYEAARRCRR